VDEWNLLVRSLVEGSVEPRETAQLCLAPAAAGETAPGRLAGPARKGAGSWGMGGWLESAGSPAGGRLPL